MTKSEGNKLESRRGRFIISNGFLGSENLGFFQPFMIYDARSDFGAGSIEYKAFSPLFEPIPDGETAPLYDIEVNKDRAGNMTFNATIIEF